MLTLPFIEVMVIRACNLSCQACTTFSDLRYSGYQTWEQGQAEFEPWIKRVHFESVGFIGGEPLINPDLANWIIGIRKLLPNSQIRFVTNGLLLKQNWHIFELLRDLENTVFKISYHIKDQNLDSCIDKIMSSCEWQPVHEFGISRWKDPDRNFRFQLNKPTKFLKTFRGNYENMAPYHNKVADAFDNCLQQKCPILYQGRLWKCGTMALMPELLDKFNRPNYEQWLPYLDQGLPISCSQAELETYVKNFGKPHSKCGQCPSKQDQDSIIDHTTTVILKKFDKVKNRS